MTGLQIASTTAKASSRKWDSPHLVLQLGDHRLKPGQPVWGWTSAEWIAQTFPPGDIGFQAAKPRQGEAAVPIPNIPRVTFKAVELQLWRYFICSNATRKDSVSLQCNIKTVQNVPETHMIISLCFKGVVLDFVCLLWNVRQCTLLSLLVLPAGLQSVHVLCCLRTIHSRDCYLIYSWWVNRGFTHAATLNTHIHSWWWVS